MDLPEIYFENQIFVVRLGQKRASRNVSHSRNQSIDSRNRYIPVSYFEVILGGNGESPLVENNRPRSLLRRHRLSRKHGTG